MTEDEARAILGKTITFETSTTPGVVQEGVADEVRDGGLLLRGDGATGIPLATLYNVTVAPDEPEAGADHALEDDTESGAPR